jgi:formate hydrogenlyase subunit 3/multisubunit Na+/H+ antiporter MnhD subunit
MNWKDFLLFIIFPVCVSSYLSLKGYTFKDELSNLITGISIFGGFLFNLLAIIYGQIDKIKIDAEKEESSIKKIFVREIHINISFCIILSIVLVLTLLFSTIDFPTQYSKIIERTITGINYFLMILFLLTLLMVLNRVYILFKKNSE